MSHLRILTLVGLVAASMAHMQATPVYGVTDLGTLGGTSSTGYSINASGQVVGQASTASGDSHAFVYAAQAMGDLGVLSGGFQSQANGIDASGQVAGTSYSSGGAQAALWTGNLVSGLGTLGGGDSMGRR